MRRKEEDSDLVWRYGVRLIREKGRGRDSIAFDGNLNMICSGDGILGLMRGWKLGRYTVVWCYLCTDVSTIDSLEQSSLGGFW